MKWNKIVLPEISDLRGNLSFVEDKDIFPIKRIFYIYGVTGERGGHAHKKCKQAIIAISGGMTLTLNDGENVEIFNLSNPCEVVIIDNLVWVEISNITKESICLVLASEYYDEIDYVRDYKEFLEIE